MASGANPKYIIKLSEPGSLILDADSVYYGIDGTEEPMTYRPMTLITSWTERQETILSMVALEMTRLLADQETIL